MNVEARLSCFHIIIGHMQHGSYICIPNWKIGTEIVSLTDSFWNKGSIKAARPRISEADAVSIAEALAAVSSHISF